MIAPLIAAAPAAGPAAPLVIAASLIATFVPFALKLFGRGRAEADILTEPGSGEQWKVEQAHKELVAAFQAEKAAGTLTRERIQEYIDAFNLILAKFTEYAKQYERAGEGAIRSVTEATNAHLATLQAELARYADEETFSWAIIIFVMIALIFLARK